MPKWMEALNRIAADTMTAHDCESRTLDFKRPMDSVQDSQRETS